MQFHDDFSFVDCSVDFLFIFFHCPLDYILEGLYQCFGVFSPFITNWAHSTSQNDVIVW